MGKWPSNKDTALSPASFFHSLSLLMTHVHIDKVPEDAKVFQGEKGGNYFFRNGHKVYISFRAEHRSKSKFTPRRGAFLRFIENQAGL